MCSMTFDRTGSTDIGLQFSIEDLSADLYIGVILAIFSSERKSEVSRQRLINTEGGAAISSAPSTIIHVGISS